MPDQPGWHVPGNVAAQTRGRSTARAEAGAAAGTPGSGGRPEPGPTGAGVAVADPREIGATTVLGAGGKTGRADAVIQAAEVLEVAGATTARQVTTSATTARQMRPAAI
jgi:hypothetical protein